MALLLDAEKAYIREFLQCLRGGKSLVVIVSQSQEEWLYLQKATYVLGNLPLYSALQMVADVLAQTGIYSCFKGQEKMQQIEYIVELLDHNPLAVDSYLSRVAINP